MALGSLSFYSNSSRSSSLRSRNSPRNAFCSYGRGLRGMFCITVFRYPNRFDVDEVCADRPVYLARICHHIALVNSKALEIVGTAFVVGNVALSVLYISLDNN